MADLTPERIAELRALVDAAPRGEPNVIDLDGMHESRVVVGGRVVAVSNCLDEPASHHCAALAATGWSDLPALLDEVERLRFRLKLIIDRLDEFHDWRLEAVSPDCDERECDLCEWHNRLLMAVQVVQEIARGASDG